MIDEIFAEWQRLVTSAYRLAYWDRTNELLGKRISQYGHNGLHVFSEVVGGVYALQSICPEIRDLGFHHRELLGIAREEAEKDFLTKKLDEIQERGER